VNVHDLGRHPRFRPWTDPQSGVTSWLLDNCFGAVQQHFYYTNPSVSSDGRWLWLTVGHPPGPARHLAAVCLDPGDARLVSLPAAQIDEALPGLAADGQGALFGTDRAVWRADLDGGMQELWRLPADWLRGRRLQRLATHLGQASDGCLLLDGELASHSFVGIADPRDGSWRVAGEFQQRHNHAQWCPGDPNLFLIAHDQYDDPVSGQRLHHRLRTIVMDRAGARYQAINPQFPASPFRGACHEWWSGPASIAYIDYASGVHEYDLASGATTHVWREPLCHAHSDPGNRRLVADQSPYLWPDTPCQVLHFDRLSGRRTAIASALPPPPGPPGRRGRYHIDPHPQFAGDWIVWTSTCEGRVTVALTPAAAVS